MYFEHDGTTTPAQMMEFYDNTSIVTHAWRPSEGYLGLCNPTLVKKTFFNKKHVFPKMTQDHNGVVFEAF